MKTKKTIGICATLLAALLCAVPQSASALQTGKIRSVEVVNADGNDRGTLAKPLRVGDTIRITFRLVNLDWNETTANPGYTNPWSFAYTGHLTGNETEDQLQQLAANKPCLGLWMGGIGKVREAKCVNEGSLSDWLADVIYAGEGQEERHYTDLVFEYTIQAGDLALPLQFANESGTGPATGSEKYYLKNNEQPVKWALKDETRTKTADFAFGPSNLLDDPDFTPPLRTWNSWIGGRNYEFFDPDLSVSGVYVQAINFDQNYADKPANTIWRTVAQGSTTVEPLPPTITIDGGAARAMDLYIWTDNTNIAEIVSGGRVIETDPDETGKVYRKVQIYAGDTSVPFNIKATGTSGQTAQVFLSATPTNIYRGVYLITNFLTRTIQVTDPLPPGIDVKVNDDVQAEATANADSARAPVSVNVTLSEEWSGDDELKIPIKVSVKDDPALDVRKYVGMSTERENDNLSWDDWLTVTPGSTFATRSLWMYANRGTVDTENGLIVEVDTNRLDATARAFFTGKFKSATLFLKRSTPEVTTRDLYIPDVEANTPKEVTINVADAYGELQPPCVYTVYWSREGGTTPDVVITNLVPTASGDLTFSVTYTRPNASAADNFTAKYWVKNFDGKSSEVQTAIVHVKAQKKVTATVTSSSFAEDYENPQQVVTLSFGEDGFSMPNGEPLGYVFFVPRNDSSSNRVECADFELDAYNDWKGGVAVYPGEPTAGPFTMYLLDNNKARNERMGYDIYVRSAPSWDEGYTVSAWSSQGFTFTVTNVVPSVTQASMSGFPAVETESGFVIDAHASLGVSKIFTAETSEPSRLDLEGDRENGYSDNSKTFVTKWVFVLGSTRQEFKVNGSPYETALTNVFNQAGTWTATVSMRDKDMISNGKETWGPEFKFKFVVDEKPAVTLTPYNGLNSFYEDAIDDLGCIKVNLTMEPPEEITVHIDVRRADPDAAYPLPVLDSYDVNFGGSSGNKTEAEVYFQELDGTALGFSKGYILNAVVTNTTKNSDGVAWTNLYAGGTLKVKILNLPPEVLTRPGTNEVRKAENESFTIKYDVQDVPADFAAGLKLTWASSEGERYEEQISVPNGVGQYVIYHGESPSFSFKYSGPKEITLLVEDKDGGALEQTRWRFYVLPSKALFIYPRQPDQLSGRDGHLSQLSSLYTGARGLGDGRVWSDGAVVNFTNFIHKYTYDPTAPEANVFAHGYKVGDVDNGSLQPGPDIAIDRYGAHFISGTYGPYYTSRELKGLDSFFYCWILNESGEGNGGYTGSLLNFLPAVEAKGVNIANGQQPVKLPEYEEDLETYSPTVLEAIFSKEYLHTDNMGDINQDGIPDKYAVDRTYDGGKLYAFATGSGDGGDTSSAADVKQLLTDFNGDGDRLPADSMATGNILITADSWTTVGEPFTAELEIRGFDRNLNYRVVNDGLNYNVLGAWVSEPTFSPAESNAIVYMNKKLNIHEFIWPVDPTNAEHVANWRTGLDKENAWIPENRTDPTIDDTDHDGFPDGYEYYFWYMSTVGWMDDKGNWKRLEGERFQLDDIAKGVPITPDEIAVAFNPTVAADKLDLLRRDTDGDGLTDLEELAAGTNPVHWDTDGDGMSDLWEILRGLDPLKKDSGANPDGDFMALVDLKEDYAILTFTTNKVTEHWALPNNGYGFVDTKTSVILEAATGTVSGVQVYRYGNDTSPWTPVYRPALKDNWAGEKPVPDVEKMDKLDLAAVLKANGFAEEEGEDGDEEEGNEEEGAESARYAALKENVVALTNQHIRLVHDQVYAQYGYDPRTGWNKNDKGYVADRWDTSKSTAKYAGDTGKAIHTEKFTSLHEYLLLKYRYNTRPTHWKVNPADPTDKTYSVSRDKAAIASRKETLADVLTLGTTNPNVPYEEKTYGNLGVSTPDSNGSGDGSGDGSGGTSSTPTTYSSTNHGADTDEDGVPDGWELYVGHNPNTSHPDDLKNNDGDQLGFVAEYAGTDSCNAYLFATNGVGGLTIYANHPGNDRGWYNKFFPTDPWNGDTDGDGLKDDEEGKSWKAAFRYGNLGSNDGLMHDYTFIYGPNEGKPEGDDGTICIRGGGLNPCTVDTDGDLLPDAWEHDFAGVVFNADGQPDTINLDEGFVRLFRRSDGLAAGAKAVQPYITGGMDGTHGSRMESAVQTGDAFTNMRYVDPFTGTKRNFDFDHDGLQNFQEYLVQSLRHLRYDDKDTPLMGQWMPDGTPKTRQFFAFVPMNIMDGETFYAKCKAAGFPATGAWKFGEIGYFARPPHEWDLVAQNTYSKKMVNYDDHGYRVMLRPQFTMGDVYKAGRYCSTDPRMFDTDGDGMDDYYEIFHGLNPLLGHVGDPADGVIANDVIAQAYQGKICWWSNGWTGWPMMPTFGDGNSPYDAMKYPWMMGTPQADADGDGIINSDEALLVNLATPMPMHTDPTPLWMTDSSSPAKASYTVQYYQMDPDVMVPDFATGAYPWNWNATDDSAADQKFWMFSFEENEGFDTDHDGLNDLSERTTTSTVASDPLNFSDPDRRQALWFPGANSAAVSYNSAFRRELALEYSLLKRFTVEAWICPEDVSREQVILERAVNCTPDTLSNNVSKVRANFRIGITADGYLYGQFDTTDAIETGSGDSSPKVVSIFPQVAGEWTHVALSYNGSELRIYVNGKMSGMFQTSLIPANGIIVTAQDAVPDNAAFPVLVNGYEVQDSALVLGARALTKSALQLKPATDMNKTTWADFDSFYAGYIDEVRVWDDVRTGEQLHDSMGKRFSFADVKALREEVYDSWRRNGTRNENDGYPNLPAELVMHYNFQTLYGGTDAASVAHEPVGFSKKVVDNVRVDGDVVPGGLFCGWWYGLKDTVGSTVYRNYYIVPWIPNTCAHLPFLDGSAGDSWYWSEYLGGVAYVSEILPGSTAADPRILFPNSANPYPYQNYVGDRSYHRSAIRLLYDTEPAACRELYNRCNFDARTGLVGCSDLVPLGGAFAKRAAQMWDGDGAATAWELATEDEDADGIPDWWEAVAVRDYGAAEDFAWDSEVVYNGVTMTAREAYLRDLARGMLPDGTIDAAYRTQTDTNNNGLPDWWENLYGVKTALDDDDGDGLSNYAEYLIGECFVNYGFPRVNPSMPHSLGQAVPDYFLRVGNLYLGEMFSDHDMMEDLWEDQYDVRYISRYEFDAQKDEDQDGWSNFAECRANTDPSLQSENAIDGFIVAQYPIPTIKATIVYNRQDTLRYPVIVEAYSKSSADIPDAMWASGTSATLKKYIGLNPNTVWKQTLGPGSVRPGSVKVYFKDPNWWTGSYTNKTYGALSNAEWHEILEDEDTTAATSRIVARMLSGGILVGTINYRTGEISIDFTALQGEVRIVKSGSTGSQNDSDPNILLATSYVYLEWESEVPVGNSLITLSLVDSLPNSATFKSRGYVREGQNMFVAYLDKNSDNKWTPGEPYGVAKNVDVGWAGAEFTVELTEVAPQMYRINLANAFASNDFESQRAFNDRGSVGYPGGPNVASALAGTDMPMSTELDVRLRVVRTKINEALNGRSVSASQAVLDTIVHPQVNPIFSEKNVLERSLDLDWGTLGTRAQEMGLDYAAITNVTYRLVVGDGTVAPNELNNNLSTLFQNKFEVGGLGAQTPCEPVSPKGTIYSGQPMFQWRHPNTINKDYPAFRLRVWDANGSTMVYDSGVQQAPARDPKGVYSWAAPIYADTPTPLGYIFATTNNYQWSVSMLDAKFTDVNVPELEAKQPFRLEASGVQNGMSGYGTIYARVKYFGPGGTNNGLPQSVKKIFRVQAFTTPDFSGMPVGEGWVTNVNHVATTNALVVNAIIRGVPPGTYYVRVYLDSNGNCVRDEWESWGYGCYVGAVDAPIANVLRGDSNVSAVKFPYTPRAYKVVAGAESPVADIYLEDVDSQNDGFPDVYEVRSLGTDLPPASGNTFFTRVNPDLAETVNAYTDLGAKAGGGRAGYAAMSLMSTILAGTDEAAIASAGALLSAAPESPVAEERTVVTITSFSLEKGAEIAVGTVVPPAASGQSVVITKPEADVDLYLSCAKTLDFADAVEVKVKSFTIRANETTTMKVGADELSAAKAKAPEAKFFKAIIR